MRDAKGDVTVQVKLQRSERGSPVVKTGARYGFNNDVFVVETQKTRTGLSGDEKTRPYRYGEFDIIAVATQPSTGRWDGFMYSLGRWMLEGKGPNEMATLQPVSMEPSAFWTDSFEEVVAWFRDEDGGKRLNDTRRRVPKGIAL